MQEILVVDDEIGIRELLSEILSDEGYKITLAQNASEARNSRNDARPDMVLLDIWMPDTDGITLLKEWASNGQLTMPVVMMSGHGTIDTAVEATRIGGQSEIVVTPDREKLARYGEVTAQTIETLTLKVKRDRVIPACKALLDELPVRDIDIQEVPIEEVIRQIFNRG